MNVPYRLSKAVLDRFGHFVAEAVRNAPRSSIFSPQGLTSDGFAQGVRNAINAKLTHDWPFGQIDELPNWRETLPLLRVITRKDGDVEIVPFTPMGATAKAVPTAPTVFDGPTLTVTDPSWQVLERLCYLVTAKVLQPAPTFTIKQIDEQTKNALREEFDVEFVTSPTGETSII
jgi:hypothetical protein